MISNNYPCGRERSPYSLVYLDPCVTQDHLIQMHALEGESKESREQKS